MEDAINYSKYKKQLINHCRKVISEFSRTRANQDVYIFVIDAQSDIGTTLIRWNTYWGLNETLKLSSYKAKTKDEIYKHNGLKYSIGDFYFEELVPDPDLEKLERKYTEFMGNSDEEDIEYNHNKFMTTLVEVLLEIKSSFELLHKTEEFISYVVDHDDDDFMYLRKTVDEEAFYKAFPELKDVAIY
ncbi:DUF4303 domain-containing protein [Cohnella endophytica]|uniref:DUF4303 domain-containing protein n=1 Tax=Cohnella endophytica TaxID=2419778 RepID=A0A494X158_9BACL|nr:DUF4303 domain-containing protein [Cohnella endophytica]RKP44062.1 DUF4303 domain-containing protein [Cohnella endophytica]